MTTDITPEAVARTCTSLRDWGQIDEGVTNNARSDAVDMLEALTAERDALAARVAELGAENARLRDAGIALIERWDSQDWKSGHTLDFITQLRAAIKGDKL